MNVFSGRETKDTFQFLKKCPFLANEKTLAVFYFVHIRPLLLTSFASLFLPRLSASGSLSDEGAPRVEKKMFRQLIARYPGFHIFVQIFAAYRSTSGDGIAQGLPRPGFGVKCLSPLEWGTGLLPAKSQAWDGYLAGSSDQP